nr:sulfite exporter TauE/SafE family protein [Bathymodiolus platifrons methanotrophic gill symbiont]
MASDSLGGIVGLLIGSVLLTPVLAPEIIRMLFTVMAVSLAFTLICISAGFRLNHINMPEINLRETGILLMIGVVGGTISGLVGSGIDMICFSVLVLLFRISESIATPTSVILMAINSVFGVLLQRMLKIYSGIAAKIVPAKLKHLCCTIAIMHVCLESKKKSSKWLLIAVVLETPHGF